MNYLKYYSLLICAAFSLAACSSSDSEKKDEEQNKQEEPEVSSNGFAKGADVSWITEMESKGEYVCNSAGTRTDCFVLMKELGLNAVRLRVWVDPSKKANGWCDKADVVAKAVRAKNAGLDVMIDFHYSDWWADPGQQHKPASWKGLGIDALKKALADHTKEVLQAIKDKGVDVKWVQVGNEIRPGMLWDETTAVCGAAYDVRYCDVKDSGNTSTAVQYHENLPVLGALLASGYDAVRAVYPQAKVIVHIDRGHEDNIWFYDKVKANGGKWDIIGLSLYPYWVKDEIPDANAVITRCITQITNLYNKYKTDVMIVEVGMQCADEKGNLASQSILDEGKRQLSDILTKCQDLSYCKGVFYWEPECRPNKYALGAFDSNGRPTVIMDAFK